MMLSPTGCDVSQLCIQYCLISIAVTIDSTTGNAASEADHALTV